MVLKHSKSGWCAHEIPSLECLRTILYIFGVFVGRDRIIVVRDPIILVRDQVYTGPWSPLGPPEGSSFNDDCFL